MRPIQPNRSASRTRIRALSLVLCVAVASAGCRAADHAVAGMKPGAEVLEWWFTSSKGSSSSFGSSCHNGDAAGLALLYIGAGLYVSGAVAAVGGTLGFVYGGILDIFELFGADVRDHVLVKNEPTRPEIPRHAKPRRYYR